MDPEVAVQMYVAMEARASKAEAEVERLRNRSTCCGQEWVIPAPDVMPDELIQHATNCPVSMVARGELITKKQAAERAVDYWVSNACGACHIDDEDCFSCHHDRIAIRKAIMGEGE